jgi:large subunit ribosomal protein L2
MGKRILVQRRGRGTPTFRSATHKRVAPAKYIPLKDVGTKLIKGVVKALVHDPGRGSPLALIKCDNGKIFYNIACEGMYVGQEIQIGEEASPEIGNILQIGKIPEGSMIYNIEKLPDDGGKFVRTSGGYATLISHTPAGTVIKFGSGKSKILDSKCRATLGIVAGTGRTEKPFMKSGERYYLMRAKGRKYPMVRGEAMIAAYHPFGGGRHQHPGRPKTVARGTPPGRKVGLIAARQTGRAKKTRRMQEET